MMVKEEGIYLAKGTGVPRYPRYTMRFFGLTLIALNLQECGNTLAMVEKVYLL